MGTSRVELSATERTLSGMTEPRSKDPLHGITLEKILTELAEEFGWEELAHRIPVRCFLYDPSIKSSLTFLRRTPWARSKVEEMYVHWKKAQGSDNVRPS